MIIWGKVIGAVLGLILYGPVGIILGLVFGQIFDNGLSTALNTKVHTEHIRQVFFATVFQVMGCLAKADGVVSENDIRVARNIMLHDFRLTKPQMMAAIEFFNEGKATSFDLGIALNKFKASCVKQPDLRRYFLELIVKAAIADQVLWPNVLNKLHFICDKLDVPLAELDYQLRSYNFRYYTKQHHTRNYNYTPETPLAAAYTLLGVSANDDNKKIKTAYRKLMQQYHPDKLIAKGLPAEMINVAKEKAQQITGAYDLIMRNRT